MVSAIVTETDYSTFHGFRHPPFGSVIDPGAIFHAPSRQALLDGIAAEVMSGHDVTAVRGGAGVGKTVLLHTLAQQLRDRAIVVLELGSGSHMPREIHRLVSTVLGISPGDGTSGLPDAVSLLHLAQAGAAVDRLMVLVDDAEMLPVQSFRYLSLLVRLFRPTQTYLQLVVFGRLGPWPNLRLPDSDELRRAAFSRHLILRLNAEESAAYLEHKLLAAGRPRRQIMTDGALADLIEQAQGAPAELDAMAEQALIHACAAGRHRITRRVLRRAIADVAPALAAPSWDGSRDGMGIRWLPISAAVVVLLVMTGIFAAAMGLRP